MNIKTRTSTFVLTLLMTSPAVMAMDDLDPEQLSPPKTMLAPQDTPTTTPIPSEGWVSFLTGGRFGASSAEQLPSSSALVPSSSSIDQDLQSTTPLTRLVPVSLEKALKTEVTEGAVVVRNNGIVTVLSDNTTLHTHQVKTGSFRVTAGEYIEVTYDITADAGRTIGLGLLKGDNSYLKTNLLKKGKQTGTFVAVVPEGESEISLIFYNNSVTVAPTLFTVHNLKIEVHKSAPPKTWFSLLTLGLFDPSPVAVEQRPSSSALVPSPSSSSIDQDFPSATPSIRCIPVAWEETSKTGVTEGAVIKESDGIITVTSDNRRLHTYPLETDRFSVTTGELLRITYDITADADQTIGLDLLNSERDSWYCKNRRVILRKGRQVNTFMAAVPPRESETSLIFYNNRVTFDPTQLTIHSLKIEILPQLLSILPEGGHPN